ncbi:MAG TPA: alpha/beta hydrolase [Candidatus Kapabacteria bacterium]|nr:alpha/beta hydrolase [Candidatus Kapabacteria bacterium]HPO63422.1 alpha/beta hydrolase [Candidatus Kapabacteria bacterium]
MEKIEEKYINAGTTELFVKVIGKGSPAVVIETTLGCCSTEWLPIQLELSKYTTVISYDRAGYAESPIPKTKRSSWQIATELNLLLKNLNIPAPFVFIGNSIGGLYLQHFAKLFPEMVCGLILADSITIKEKDFNLIDAPTYQQFISMTARINNIKALLELDNKTFENQILPMLQMVYANIAKEIKSSLLKYYTEKKLYRTVIEEYELLDESINEINAIFTFPNIPIKVLCRDSKEMIRISNSIGIPEDEAKAVEEFWLQTTQELLNLSEQSEFKIVAGSNHSIHLSSPIAIIEETLDMLEKIRKQ